MSVLGDWWSIMRSKASRTGVRILLLSLGLLVAIGILAALAAPDLGHDVTHDKYAGMFATIAQVVATLLVALAVEARLLAAIDQRLRVATALAVVVCVGVSIAASVALMSRGLPECFYAPLFGVSVGGGLAALVMILVLAGQGLYAAFGERDTKAERAQAGALRKAQQKAARKENG
jgi:hypothetical protein